MEKLALDGWKGNTLVLDFDVRGLHGICSAVALNRRVSIIHNLHCWTEPFRKKHYCARRGVNNWDR
jgi:hypothetical protein